MAMSVTGMRRPGSTQRLPTGEPGQRAGPVLLRGRGGVARRDRQPPEHVEHGPDAGDRREHDERQPHQRDRQVEVRGDSPSGDAAEPPPARRAAQRQPARRARGAVAVGCTVRSSHAPRPSGVASGVGSGVRARQDQGAVRGAPDAAALVPSEPGSRHGHEHSRQARTAGAGRPQHRTSPADCRSVEQLLRRHPPPRHLPRRRPLDRRRQRRRRRPLRHRPAAGPRHLRRDAAARRARPRRRTASPGRCCPSAATAASTSRR